MNKNYILKRFIVLILVILIIFLPVGCSVNGNSEISPLTVNILDVGKADAIIIVSDSHAMLIDTGEKDDGQKIADFLENHNIKKVDAMVITHFDKDHIGGAPFILKNIPVETVYIPNYKGVNEEYKNFIKALNESDASINKLNEDTDFSFANSKVLIEPPASYSIPKGNVDYDNNFSLITTLIHGKNRFVFMGDAQKERILDWLDNGNATECSFLKVPHHGIYNKALEPLFEKMSAQISVICSSKKHPADSKTIDLLKKYCREIYETKDGDICVTSDGHSLKVCQKERSNKNGTDCI